MFADDAWIDYVVLDLLDNLEDYQKDDGLLYTRCSYQNRSDYTGNRRTEYRYNRRHGRQKGNRKGIWETEDDECDEHYDSQN